jgi:hypothetical protein
MKCLLSTAAALSVLLLAAGPTGDDAALIAAQKPCYPLTTCVVSGKPIVAGGPMKPVDIIYEGRLVSFCCGSCQKDFDKAPADFIKKIDDAVISAQKANYPLDTCPISGEKLDASAKSFVVGTKLVMTCCGDCKKEVMADPSRALVALDAAYIAKQEKDYPLTSCPVSDEPLGDKPYKMLYGTTLVELCCKDCVKEVAKAPQVVMAKITAARTGKPAAPAEPKKEAPAAPK